MNKQTYIAISDAIGFDTTPLERRFQAFDRTRCGVIRASSFMAALRETGINLRTVQLEQLVKDYAKDEMVRYHEFLDDFSGMAKRELEDRKECEDKVKALEALPACGVRTDVDHFKFYDEGEDLPKRVINPLSEGARLFLKSLKYKVLTYDKQDAPLGIWQAMLVNEDETIDAEQFISRSRRIVNADSLNVDAEDIRECYRRFSPGNSARAGLDLASFRRMCAASLE